MISFLSLFLGFALIGLVCTLFGVVLSLFMGLLGLTTKKLSFSDSVEASMSSLKPAFITAAILVVPGCLTLLRLASNIPDFLYYEDRFGKNNDTTSGFFLFVYIFSAVFIILYISKIRKHL
ncbi:hypothetical protein [Thalassotalea sp. G2M2-11]|uniref:hypothetical protein n=1 Tax=Thalassotalea sp. G2M2-11 TaxID=2787627 RepID=UPI0019CF564B|nr:hypothetical protein [Thalassotalea sp. G2M2-11]